MLGDSVRYLSLRHMGDGHWATVEMQLKTGHQQQESKNGAQKRMSEDPTCSPRASTLIGPASISRRVKRRYSVLDETRRPPPRCTILLSFQIFVSSQSLRHQGKAILFIRCFSTRCTILASRTPQAIQTHDVFAVSKEVVSFAFDISFYHSET